MSKTASAPEVAPAAELGVLPSLSPDLLSRKARDIDAIGEAGDILFRKGSATATRWRSYDHKDVFEPPQRAIVPPTDAEELGSWQKYEGSGPLPASQARTVRDDEHPTSWSKYETKPLASLLGSTEGPRSKALIQPAESELSGATPTPPPTVAQPVAPEQTVAIEGTPSWADGTAADAAAARPQEPTVIVEAPAVAAEAPISVAAAAADGPVADAPEPDLETESVAPELTVIEEPPMAVEAVPTGEPLPVIAEPTAQAPSVSAEAPAAAATLLEIASPGIAAAASEDPSESVPSEASDVPALPRPQPLPPPEESLPSLEAPSEPEPISHVALPEASAVEMNGPPHDDVPASAEGPEPAQSIPAPDVQVDARRSAPVMPAPASEATPVEPPQPPGPANQPAIGVPASGKNAMLARLAAMLEQALAAKRSMPLAAPVEDASEAPREPPETIESESVTGRSSDVVADPSAADTSVVDTSAPAAEAQAPASESLTTAPLEEAAVEVVPWQEELARPDALETGVAAPIETEAQPAAEIEITTALVRELELEPEAPFGAMLEPEARTDDPVLPAASAAAVKTRDPAKKAVLAHLAEMLERAIAGRRASELQASVATTKSTAPTVPIAAALEVEATTPVDVTPQPEVSDVSPPSEAGLLEAGALLESEAQVAETPVPSHAEALGDSDEVMVHEASRTDTTPVLEALDELAAAERDDATFAASEPPGMPSSDGSVDAEIVALFADPTPGIAAERAPSAAAEDATRADAITSEVREPSASSSIGEAATETAEALREPGTSASAQQPEIPDPIEKPVVAASSAVSEASASAVVSAELAIEPPLDAPALVPTGNLESSTPSMAPPPAAADLSLTPAQQENAIRQALTDDLAEVINSVLGETQFATKALKPKRQAEVQQEADQSDLSELAEELAASLPQPVAIRSGFGRLERVLAFASIGMMVAIGYFGLSLWREQAGAPAHAPAAAIATTPADDRGASAALMDAPKAPDGRPEADATTQVTGPQSPRPAR